MRIVIFFSIIFVHCLSIAQNENDLSIREEFEVISTLFTQTHDNKLCQHFLTRESIESLKRDKPLFYKHLSKKFVRSEDEFSTISKFYILEDSLQELDFSDEERHIIRRLDENSPEFEMIKDSKPFLSSIENKKQLWSLHNNFQFFSLKETDSLGIQPYKYQRQLGKLNLGFVSSSRVLYSRKYNRGIFKFTYLGGGTCGTVSLIIFKENENSEWEIIENIIIGQF